MNIRVFTKEKDDVSVATLIKDYKVTSLNFSQGVLKINDGEKSLQFKNVKTFNLEI